MKCYNILVAIAIAIATQLFACTTASIQTKGTRQARTLPYGWYLVTETSNPAYTPFSPVNQPCTPPPSALQVVVIQPMVLWHSQAVQMLNTGSHNYDCRNGNVKSMVRSVICTALCSVASRTRMLRICHTSEHVQ